MSNSGRRWRSTSSIAPSPATSSPSSGLREPQPLPQWKFSQVLGELPPSAAGGHRNGVLQDDDEISAVEFDGRGEFLAAGDHSGRVILFRRTDDGDDGERSRADLERTDYAAGAPAPPRYGYATEFQSHEQEFDVLHSLEIGEKIKKVRWCARPNSSLCMLAANDRTVKLWKVSEHKAPTKKWRGGRGLSLSLQEPYSERATSTPRSSSADPDERSEKLSEVGDGYSAKCRRVFDRAHQFNIHSISNNCDGETFVSADDLRINLWHLEVTTQCFNIVDTKPPDMEDLGDHRGGVPPVVLQHAGLRQLQGPRPAGRPAAVGTVRPQRENVPGSREPTSAKHVFHRDHLLHHRPQVHWGWKFSYYTRLHEPQALGLARGNLPCGHIQGARVPSSKAVGALHRGLHLRQVQLLRQQGRELLRHWILQQYVQGFLPWCCTHERHYIGS